MSILASASLLQQRVRGLRSVTIGGDVRVTNLRTRKVRIIPASKILTFE